MNGSVSSDHQHLWSEIQERLYAGVPDWRALIVHYQQVSAIEARERGRHWSDADVFEALVRSVLSNSTDWAKVERVLPELSARFFGFDPDWYGNLNSRTVEDELLPWFRVRRAGSMTLRRDLMTLIQAARRLCILRVAEGSLEHYFQRLFDNCGRDPKRMALALGSPKSPAKLPTLGVPLAAEFLKNLGFDISKPDRHINRAVGSFGWVNFRTWANREGTSHPSASEAEMSAVMGAMELFASAVGERIAFVDNAVWLACAKSGLYMSNSALAAISR